MFVYSEKSNIVHTDTCLYGRRIKAKQCVSSMRKLPKKFRPCLRCSKLGTAYRKEQKKIRQYLAGVKNVECYYKKGEFIIKTSVEEFRIITSVPDNELIVYHRNTDYRRHENSNIPGFHVQNWKFTSIKSIIKKAIKHTDYIIKYRNNETHENTVIRINCEGKVKFKFNCRAYFKKMAQKLRKNRTSRSKKIIINKKKKSSKYFRAKYDNYEDYFDVIEQYGVKIKF